MENRLIKRFEKQHVCRALSNFHFDNQMIILPSVFTDYTTCSRYYEQTIQTHCYFYSCDLWLHH